jgi:hypothetical protein
MNMVEKQMVTFGFNNENPRNLITPSIQQLCDQPNKATTQKYKGTKKGIGWFPIIFNRTR